MAMTNCPGHAVICVGPHGQRQSADTPTSRFFRTLPREVRDVTRRRPGPRTPAQEAWARSSRFRETGRAMMKRFNLLRAFGPKCGARTRRDGHPCQHPAMANGRCFRHGGRTPKGDQWHQPQWPDADAPNWEAKLHRKLRDRERAAKKRAVQLKAMTPEERAAHGAWQRAHKPGSAAKRTMARKERADAAAFRAVIDARPLPQTKAETARQELERVRQLLAMLKPEGPSGSEDQPQQEDLFE